LRPLQPNSISEKAHAPRDREFEILPEICVACNNLQIGRFSGVGYMTATADVRDGSEAEETGPVRLSTDSDRLADLKHKADIEQPNAAETSN
jgi:hypothetical protein